MKSFKLKKLKNICRIWASIISKFKPSFPAQAQKITSSTSSKQTQNALIPLHCPYKILKINRKKKEDKNIILQAIACAWHLIYMNEKIIFF